MRLGSRPGASAFARFFRVSCAAHGGPDRRVEFRAAPRRRLFRRAARTPRFMARARRRKLSRQRLATHARATSSRGYAARSPHGPGRSGPAPRTATNPYAGLLGWADRLVVTPDSVNMISEACATGKPVYTFAPRPIARQARGVPSRAPRAAAICACSARRRTKPQPPPLAETREIAELVRARWVVHRAARADA